MKARFLIAALLAALVVPAVSIAAEGPAGQDRENASRACKALRASMGDAIFKQSFGTVQSNRRNAHGALRVPDVALRAAQPPGRADRV